MSFPISNISCTDSKSCCRSDRQGDNAYCIFCLPSLSSDRKACLAAAGCKVMRQVVQCISEFFLALPGLTSHSAFFKAVQQVNKPSRECHSGKKQADGDGLCRCLQSRRYRRLVRIVRYKYKNLWRAGMGKPVKSQAGLAGKKTQTKQKTKKRLHHCRRRCRCGALH